MEIWIQIVCVVLVSIAIGIPIGLWLKAREKQELERVEAGLPRKSSIFMTAAHSAVDKGKNRLKSRQAHVDIEQSLLKYQALEKLKSLLDSGAISEQYFAIERNKILGKTSA